MPQLPNQRYLSRKIVLTCVGGWRRLQWLEAAQKLHRHYPAGLKRARYLREEVAACIDTPALPLEQQHR